LLKLLHPGGHECQYKIIFLAISGQDDAGLAIRIAFPLLVSIYVTLKGPVSKIILKNKYRNLNKKNKDRENFRTRRKPNNNSFKFSSE
jgi:hypothetical protein